VLGGPGAATEGAAVIAGDGAEWLKAISVTGSGAGIRLFGTLCYADHSRCYADHSRCYADHSRLVILETILYRLHNPTSAG
jgi:hypothetical protein